MPNPYQQVAEDAAKAPLNLSTFLKAQKERRKKERELQNELDKGYHGK